MTEHILNSLYGPWNVYDGVVYEMQKSPDYFGSVHRYDIIN